MLKQKWWQIISKSSNFEEGDQLKKNHSEYSNDALELLEKVDNLNFKLYLKILSTSDKCQ